MKIKIVQIVQRDRDRRRGWQCKAPRRARQAAEPSLRSLSLLLRRSLYRSHESLSLSFSLRGFHSQVEEMLEREPRRGRRRGSPSPFFPPFLSLSLSVRRLEESQAKAALRVRTRANCLRVRVTSLRHSESRSQSLVAISAGGLSRLRLGVSPAG